MPTSEKLAASSALSQVRSPMIVPLGLAARTAKRKSLPSVKPVGSCTNWYRSIAARTGRTLPGADGGVGWYGRRPIPRSDWKFSVTNPDGGVEKLFWVHRQTTVSDI